MKLFFIILFVGISCCANIDPKVSPSLSASLSVTDPAIRRWDLVVEMEGGTTSVLKNYNSMSTLTSTSREEKAGLLARALLSHSTLSQQAVISALSDISTSRKDVFSYSSSWISNVVFVQVDKSPDNVMLVSDLISRLVQIPGVALVREQVVAKLGPVVAAVSDGQTLAREWNIDKVGAPHFWETNKTTGAGIIVGHIDSGVRNTHEALRSNWIGGQGGWLDPYSGQSVPYDSSTSSHGTHSLASAVGSNGVGIAPGARWTSCLGCYRDVCEERELACCGQFMLCPLGSSQFNNCTGIPNIVTNSWGSLRGGQTFYDQVISAWLAVGIVPVFAAGNSGPQCETLGSPGDNPSVVSVGATSEKDELANFSSVGPSVNRILKPDIVAPGVRIRSATANSDTSYGVLSGTSMAAPQIAGALALYLSANPSLTYAQVKAVLTEGAERKGLSSVRDVQNCGGISDTTWPNHKFGFGRLRLGPPSGNTDNAGSTPAISLISIVLIVLSNIL